MKRSNEYKLQNYYLAEIDTVEKGKSVLKMDRWSWDIYIATNENKEYQGKAVAPGKGIEIPWTPLGKDFLEEMMGICQRKMIS